MAQLTFRPMNLERDLALAFSFRTEPNPAHTDPLPWYTAENFRDYILQKQEKLNPCSFHVWQNDAIIGQVEIEPSRFKPNAGYVNFYYLIPSLRNQGLASQLINFTDTLFRNHKFTAAQLTTSPTNYQALASYQKNGYLTLGPRPDKPHLLLLEKPLL